MPDRLYLDKETLGFVGPVILIQYATASSGDIKIVNFWQTPVRELLELFEMFLHHNVVAFNIVFDWFHAVKAYNVLKAYERQHGCSEPPERDKYWLIDSRNPSNYCLKPLKSLDLMLWCQRGPYQYVMDRKDIFVRRVPNGIAKSMRDHLDKSMTLQSALNAEWRVEEVKDKEKNVHPHFSNVVLRFRPSKSLDAISKDVLGVGKAPSFFKTLPKVKETPWKPYGGNWNNPRIFKAHTDFWHNNEEGRFYAHRDVELLQQLDEKFGRPEESTDDRLAILIANVRWRGYGVDTEIVDKVISDNKAKLVDFPININSPKQVVDYLKAGLSPIKASVIESSAKPVLEKLSKQGYERAQDVLTTRMAGSRINLFKKFANGVFHASMKVIGALSGRMSGADKLNPHGIPREIRHPFIMKYTRRLVKIILENMVDQGLDINDRLSTTIKALTELRQKIENGPTSKKAKAKWPKTLTKLLKAEKALTELVEHKTELLKLLNSEMSAVDYDKLVDPITELVYEEILSGGDFDGFEVSIADAVYDDEALRALLKSGKKVHGLFGEAMTGKSYDEILLTKEGICPHCAGSGSVGCISAIDERVTTDDELAAQSSESKCDSCKGTGVDNSYTDAKSGFFAFIYGAQAKKEAQTLKISEEKAEEGFAELKRKYVGIGKAQDDNFEKFCSMRQPVENGPVFWKEPADFEDTLLGFKRFFTLENMICKNLFQLAQSPPREWRDFEFTVERRKGRKQKPIGAAQSALFGAAFGIQSQNMRAAGNHKIQGTGAELTKRLEDEIFQLQPFGAKPWYVRPMNVHDEIQVVHRKGLGKKLKKIVDNFVKKYQDLVPLLAMSWTEDSPNWAGSH